MDSFVRFIADRVTMMRALLKDFPRERLLLLLDRHRPLLDKIWQITVLLLAAALAWLFFWDTANSVAAAPENNQIGTVRPQGTACDIGAIEYVDN